MSVFLGHVIFIFIFRVNPVPLVLLERLASPETE